MKPGISSYTFTWAVGVPGSESSQPLSSYGLVDKAAIYNLGVLQIADNISLEKLTPDEVENLRTYAVSKGVSIEMGSRGLTPEHTMECLTTAKRLDSQILRMVIDSAGFEPDLQTIISIIRELVPEFASRNIRLAIENHDRLKAREFAEIIESAGCEWVGICLDSVNSLGAGEGFGTVSEILLPYTINLHIKDFAIRRVSHKMGLIVEGTPAGKGMLNIEELAGKLTANNRCHSAILELWTPPEDDIEATILKEEKWADESIRYLKSVFS